MGSYEYHEYGMPDEGWGIPPAPPEWPPDAFLIDGELPPNYFEADMASFRSATERLNRFIPLEEEPPEHMVRVTNTQFPPFSKHLLILQALREWRYDIGLVGDVEDAKSGSPLASIVVYASIEDLEAVQRTAASSSLSRHVYGSLLFDITTGALQNSHFLPDHAACVGIDQQYAELGGSQGETLRRAFMTSTLIRGFRPWSDGSEIQKILHQDRLLYNLFKAQGLEPFSYEELFGIAETMTRNMVRSDPEFPLPYAVRKQREEALGSEEQG